MKIVDAINAIRADEPVEIKLPGARFVIGEAEGAEDYVRQQAQKLGRSCGPCSLCCKLLDIEEMEKPADRWCAHCRPGKGGCSIYADRPPVCRAFGCQWLLDETFGDHWKPSHSRMVVRMLPNQQKDAFPLRLNVGLRAPRYSNLQQITVRLMNE